MGPYLVGKFIISLQGGFEVLSGEGWEGPNLSGVVSSPQIPSENEITVARTSAASLFMCPVTVCAVFGSSERTSARETRADGRSNTSVHFEVFRGMPDTPGVHL